MNTYRIYLIGPADRFHLSNYPELKAQLSEALPQSTATPIDATASMFLSFAKHHWLNSRLAVQYPELADRIGSKDIPLSVLEQLFEASRPYPLFQHDLEAYVTQAIRNRNSVGPEDG